jgi:hypothetical protein
VTPPVTIITTHSHDIMAIDTTSTHFAADEVTLNGDSQSGMKAELDDERREVPEGWVRAFDRK